MQGRLDLLDLLSALSTAEGYWVAGTPPHEDNNPGDLRFAGQVGAVKSKHGTPPFAHFDCLGRGIANNLRQILKRVAEGHAVPGKPWQPMTLRILLTDPEIGWAPAADGNNAPLYLREAIRRVKAFSGLEIDPDKPLWDYLIIERIP